MRGYILFVLFSLFRCLWVLCFVIVVYAVSFSNKKKSRGKKEFMMYHRRWNKVSGREFMFFFNAVLKLTVLSCVCSASDCKISSFKLFFLSLSCIALQYPRGARGMAASPVECYWRKLWTLSHLQGQTVRTQGKHSAEFNLAGNSSREQVWLLSSDYRRLSC